MENIKPNSCRICLKSETFGANFENLTETVYKGGKSALTAMKEVLGIKVNVMILNLNFFFINSYFSLDFSRRNTKK